MSVSLAVLRNEAAGVPFAAAAHHLHSHKASSILVMSPFQGTTRRDARPGMSLSCSGGREGMRGEAAGGTQKGKHGCGGLIFLRHASADGPAHVCKIEYSFNIIVFAKLKLLPYY